MHVSLCVRPERMKNDVLVWAEDWCGKGKLLKFKHFASQLLRFHILLPHEVCSKSRPDSPFKGSTALIQGKLYNRLIMIKHLTVPGILKYSNKGMWLWRQLYKFKCFFSHIFYWQWEPLILNPQLSYPTAIRGATLFTREN